MNSQVSRDELLLPHLKYNQRFASHVDTSPSRPYLDIDYDNPNVFQNKLAMTLKNNQVKSCRICLGEENESENELISPCKCAGTMKYIHVKCL